MYPVDERSIRYEGWRVTAGASISVFLASLLVFTFPILLKPLAEEFSWSREAVSTAYGVTTAMSAICVVPLGYLIDRLGARQIAIPCIAVFGCVFASLSVLTPHLWHLYAVFAVLGMAVTGMLPIAFARTISSWFEQRRGLALALTIAGASFGGLVHPAAAQALIRVGGWRSACLALGASVIVLGVPTVARFMRERPSSIADLSDPSASNEGASVREGLRSRVFWILFAVLFGSSIAQQGTIVHLSALLTDRGISASDAALAVSAMAGASIVSRLLTGWLVDRFFAALVSFGVLALAAVGTFLLAGAQSFMSGALAAILIGCGIGGEADVTPYLLSRYFGLRSFSTLYSVTWIATAGAAAVGPILMGRAFDASGSYERLLTGLAVTTLSVAALMLTLPRYSRPCLRIRT